MTARPLRDDTRGAMIVIGLFICLIIAGALFYLVGLGDALIFRERTQEAADATAFSAAAATSRGMNIIVLMNLTMASILGIRVALKALFTLAVIAQVIFTVLCVIPFMQWACPIAGMAASTIAFTQTMLRTTYAPINMAITALNRSSTVIARAVPTTAVAASKQVGGRYTPSVKFALASAEVQTLAAGLPIEDGTAAKLCGEAGASIGRLLGGIFGGAGVGGKFGDWVGERLEDLVRTSPAYFCEIPGAVGDLNPKEVAANDLQKAAQDVCDAKRKAAGDAAAAKNESREEAESAFDLGTCTKDENKRFANDPAFKKGASSGDAPAGGGILPKRIVDGSGNGCAPHQTVGVSEGAEDVVGRMPVLVNVANLFQRPAKPGIARGGIKIFEELAPDAFAQAETFYDCAGSWGGEGCNADDEALWHFRWRPRLRPVDGTMGIVRTATGTLSAGVSAKLQLDRAAAMARPTSAGNQALVNELGSGTGPSAGVIVH